MTRPARTVRTPGGNRTWRIITAVLETRHELGAAHPVADAARIITLLATLVLLAVAMGAGQ